MNVSEYEVFKKRNDDRGLPTKEHSELNFEDSLEHIQIELEGMTDLLEHCSDNRYIVRRIEQHQRRINFYVRLCIPKDEILFTWRG